MGETNIPVQALWLKMGGAYGWDSMVLVHACDFLYTCTHVIVHAQEISEGLSFIFQVYLLYTGSCVTHSSEV